MKICSTCGEQKDIEDFHKGQYSCKPCVKVYTAAYYAKNKEKILEQCRNDYHSNIEERKATKQVWRDNNKEHTNARRKDYYENNKDVHKAYRRENIAQYNGYHAKRRAAKLDRTVAWADKDKMLDMYRAAKVLDFFNPCEKHHVDHIIPLQGETVSGLHIEINMQILTATENLKKGNTYVQG